jgi:endonuclease YncB( thermonuclease family)
MSASRQSFISLLVTLGVVATVAVLAIVFRRESTVTVPHRVLDQVPAAIPVTANPSTASAPGDLQLVSDARFVDAAGNSGDTFRFRTGDQEQVFLLYFADALEDSFSDVARLKTQTEFFTGATQEAVVEAGRDATRQALQLLKTHPVRVWTKWQKAPKTDRYYAMVAVEIKPGEWMYFDEWLMGQGLALAEGPATAPPPGGPTLDAHVTRLRSLAALARERRLGIWARMR